jgi:hypothetical protein
MLETVKLFGKFGVPLQVPKWGRESPFFLSIKIVAKVINNLHIHGRESR